MSTKEQFELFAEKRGLDLCKPKGVYDDDKTIAAWDAWKAATKRAAQICIKAHFRDKHSNESLGWSYGCTEPIELYKAITGESDVPNS